MLVVSLRGLLFSEGKNGNGTAGEGGWGILVEWRERELWSRGIYEVRFYFQQKLTKVQIKTDLWESKQHFTTFLILILVAINILPASFQRG